MRIGTMYLKDGEFSTNPTPGAREVKVALPAHMRLLWDGTGRKQLRLWHGEELCVVTGNDYGTPVPEAIDRWGERTRIPLAA